MVDLVGVDPFGRIIPIIWLQSGALALIKHQGQLLHSHKVATAVGWLDANDTPLGVMNMIMM